MTSCLIWECEASRCETTYLVEQGCSATNAVMWGASSSSSTPLHIALRCGVHCCSRIRKAQIPLHPLQLCQCRLLQLRCCLGLGLFRLRRLALLWLIFICIASLEPVSLRRLPRGLPIMLGRPIIIVLVLRILPVPVRGFCMGLLTCFLCRWHFHMSIPDVPVLDLHRHAKLDSELALRQRGLVNSCLHTRCHLVIVAPCPVRSL